MQIQSLLKGAPFTQLGRIVGGSDCSFSIEEQQGAVGELVGARILGVCPTMLSGELMITYKRRRARKATTIIIKAKGNRLDVLPFMAEGE